MSANPRDRVQESTAEQIKQGVREAYAARVTAPVNATCGCGTQSTGVPDRKDLIDVVGYSASDLAAVPPDAVKYSFACGNPLSFSGVKEGDVVLDIGSGAGMDALLAARLVGATGKVIGLDMTPEMIAKATENARRAGATNVEFRLGDAEQMPVQNASVDWVISNCVINLAPDKRRVFSEIFRVLKPGGRVAISDIVTGELPEIVRMSMAMWANCVGGAVKEGEYLEQMAAAGLLEAEVIARQTYDAASVRAMIMEVIPSARSAPQLVDALIASSGVIDQVWSARIVARKPDAGDPGTSATH